LVRWASLSRRSFTFGSSLTESVVDVIVLTCIHVNTMLDDMTRDMTLARMLREACNETQRSPPVPASSNVPRQRREPSLRVLLQ
jgi:hypothetical protein